MVKTKDYFLDQNKILNEFNAPNLEKIEGSFLSSNYCLKKLSLPKLKEAGSLLYAHSSLIELNVPELENLGQSSLHYNSSLEKMYAPKLSEWSVGKLAPHIQEVWKSFNSEEGKTMLSTLDNLKKQAQDSEETNRKSPNLFTFMAKKVKGLFSK